MQDRYAGDIGDYVKLGLLRHLSQDQKLGILWYKYPNESHNDDGKHIAYLNSPDVYSKLDPELFTHLQKVALSNRSIKSILPILPAPVSYDEVVDFSHLKPNVRANARARWFNNALANVSNCQIVFADPDNGIVDSAAKRKNQSKFGKQIPIDEIHQLSEKRCAIVYHHNTRRKGGHDAEVDYWLNQFEGNNFAIRAKAYSPRTFFVLNPSEEVVQRAYDFCERWASLKVSFHKNGN